MPRCHRSAEQKVLKSLEWAKTVRLSARAAKKQCGATESWPQVLLVAQRVWQAVAALVVVELLLGKLLQGQQRRLAFVAEQTQP